MPGSSEVSAINRQKFLAELAKLLSFMYEEDRRYALDMYERMFDIAEGSEQWLIQNLMSPTRQAVIIARSYDAKERKLSVSAEWKEEEEDQSEETPPFVLAINKIFDDLFPDNENLEETDSDQVSFFDQDEINKKTKKNRMPKAAVLLNQTQEFESVAASAAEGMELEAILQESREEYWTDQTDMNRNANVDAEPDPRVQIVDRKEFYNSTEEEPAAETETEHSGVPSNSETVIQTGLETAEPEDRPQPSESETSIEGQQKETPQSREQSKKRRSIEELLGFRKGKKHNEDPEQSTAELAEAAEQTAEPQSALAGSTEKVEAEPDVPAGDDPASRGLPDQKDSAEAHEKTSVKAVPLEIPVILPEETASIEAEPVEAVFSFPSEENETGKDNNKAARSQTVANSPQEQSVDSKEPQKLFFELPEEEPIIRKPEPKKKEEAVPANRVPNALAMILFFLVAIPSVPVMLILLALLVALCVSLSFGMIALGSVLIISAFSGFAVLADILLLLGAAIIALALGLLFLWLAIWLIAEVIVGLVRSVRELYQEWCYKEVPAA